VSISSTFFCKKSLYKSALQNFSLITVWLCNFWRKEIGAKAAHKMLVELTPGFIKQLSEIPLTEYLTLAFNVLVTYKTDKSRYHKMFRKKFNSIRE